jgi:methyl-accepting chemotaxis protein
MVIDRLKISGKLQLAFAVLIAAFLISSTIVYLSIVRIDAAANLSDADLVRARQAESLLTLVLEQTNALRGYVVKADPKFSATYQESKQTFDKAVDQLDATSSTDAERAQVRAMREAMAAWRAKVGDQVITLMADPATRSAAADLAGVKSLMALRAAQKQIRDGADAAALAGQTERARSVRIAVWTMVFGGLSAIGIASAMGWLLAATIARPVVQLTGVMHRLAEGDADVVPPGLSRQDELGKMAQAVQVFRQAALEKARLEAEAAAARALAHDERMRNDAERDAAAAEQAFVVDALATGLARLAIGDLGYRLTAGFQRDYEKLRDDFNMAMGRLQETMADIAANAQAMRGGAEQISHAADDLSQRTEHQAANLEQTAAALDEITATVARTADGAADANRVVTQAREDAEHSGQVVRQAIDAMGAIEDSSRKVGQIIGVIDEIAFQTNLLALNAGVEAARAGDSGRGFAVVAQEVRALAQRSAEAAKEIKALVAASERQVVTGVGLVGETGEALGRIAQQVTAISGVVGAISASTTEQATGLRQVNIAINQMDQVTQQNAAMVEQSTAASHALAGDADELARLVGQFNLEGETAAAPAARPMRLAS